MLARLVAATGLELDMRLSAGLAIEVVNGFLGERVRRHRLELPEVVARYGLSNARVFGSVARGEEGSPQDGSAPAELGAAVE